MVIAHNYVADVIAYFVMTGAAVLIFAKRRFDVLDPIVLVSVTYISLFSLAPIRDIIVNDYYAYGVNTLVNGVEGTGIAVVG